MSNTSFLNVLEENLSALNSKYASEVLNEQTPLEAVKETYEDLIAIYKSEYAQSLPVTGTEGKTLSQCKDEVARKYGYQDWQDYKNTYWDTNELDRLFNEAAELYAKQHTQRGTGQLSAKELHAILQRKIQQEEMAKGVGTCPLCGTKNLHYNPVNESYTCAFC